MALNLLLLLVIAVDGSAYFYPLVLQCQDSDNNSEISNSNDSDNNNNNSDGVHIESRDNRVEVKRQGGGGGDGAVSSTGRVGNWGQGWGAAPYGLRWGPTGGFRKVTSWERLGVIPSIYLRRNFPQMMSKFAPRARKTLVKVGGH
ncbi:hypothetical protein E2C01_053276 [Portunus trituberculatus]|uniref:Uncharacterized protein n=1 Tax=Portunus trituberculatus TaxID=210409 RepID=A0A5B7GFZ4_PORTR|nr:hypothetical protein [Portunus trituberculatus]